MESSKPSKQRAAYYQMPLHAISKTMSSHLNKKLKAEFNKRSVAIRSGDEVKVMRGEQKGKKGKIIRVDRGARMVFIEGITRRKSDGTEIPIGLRPCNLLVLALNLDDEKRLKNIRGAKRERAEKKVEKGKEEVGKKRLKKEKAEKAEKIEEKKVGGKRVEKLVGKKKAEKAKKKKKGKKTKGPKKAKKR